MFSTETASKELQCEVLERKITMSEVEEASSNGRLMSVFVVGTAFWIQEVSEIGFDGKSIEVDIGVTTHVPLLRERMTEIMFGKRESDWVDIVQES
jgi:branched-chain amino acid aminotransferase